MWVNKNRARNDIMWVNKNRARNDIMGANKNRARMTKNDLYNTFSPQLKLYVMLAILLEAKSARL